MDWVASIHQAIQYIEEHLREELTIREIAQQAALAPFYFQKGFSMLCGMTVGDYIRQRRLSAAGLEVLTTDRKIIDIALEFGYDSPDSFTKAFTRFHGLTPAALRKSGGAARSFAPLRIKVTLEGGQNMDCRIMKKEAFTVLCRAKTFKYEGAAVQVPQFWAEHFRTGGFFGRGKIHGRLYFGKHGTWCKLTFVYIFLGFFNCHLIKPLLIFFTEVYSNFFDCCQNDQHVGIKFFSE
mgnify:CR=1 FL=1